MTDARGWVLIAIVGLGACGDGQASPGYRGEPLMSLNGVVTGQSALTADLIPAVLPETSTWADLDYQQRWYISGEVEGTFPSAFTMRIYDAPPKETLFPLFEGESAFVLAPLAAVSPEHPAWVKRTSEVDDPERGDAQLCSDKECITASLWDCVEEGADILSWPCGQNVPEELHWNAYGYSASHQVLYFEEDVPAGSTLANMFDRGNAIEAGYHLLWSDEATNTPENNECMRRAITRARTEWQMQHGQPVNDVWLAASTAEQIDQERWIHPFIEMEGCDQGYRVVDEEGTVELEFIDRVSPRVGTL